jgi:hypothetical protein
MPFLNIAHDEKAKDDITNHGTFHNKPFKTFFA